MAYDGLFIHSLLQQITPALLDGKLSKIAQPFEHDLILTFRKDRQNLRLLLSANSQYPRFYFLDQNLENPDVAPTFTMVLRKYLSGSILKSIDQVGLDRIVNFHFSNRNDLGDEVGLVLSVELMGRHSNVILYDENSGQIIDLLKRVNPDENRARILLPKAHYELPPLRAGINPLTVTEDEFKKFKAELSPAEFAAKVSGLDRDDRNELTGYFEDDYSYASLQTFLKQLESPKACVLMNAKHQRRLFLYLPYHLGYELLFKNADVNAGIADFYREQANRNWVRQKAGRITTIVKNERKKLEKKLGKLTSQLDLAENSESYRIKGELLETYLNQVKPGMTKISLPNYYENNAPLEIKLDPALPPVRNAQKYFTRYQKLRDSIKYVKQQIDLAQQNLAYFDSIQTAIDNADPQDIDAITDELTEQGYLRQQTKGRRKRKKITEKNLPQFKLTSGKTVLVGKNNYENDWLTFKKANKSDYWFHVKNMPGSHTILRDSDPSEEDIRETAEIAAYFSKGRSSSHVQVDYVQDKALKKPNGAKPGFVIYRGQNSIEVTPDEESVLAKQVK